MSTAKRVAVPGARFGRRAVATQAEAVSTVRYPIGTPSTRRDAPSDAATTESGPGRRTRRRPGTGDLPRSMRTNARTVASRQSGGHGGRHRYIALMQVGGDCHQRERRPVLYLNTPTAPPLGA